MIWFNDSTILFFLKRAYTLGSPYKILTHLFLASVIVSFTYFFQQITQFVQYLLSNDAVAAFSKEIILFVKFSLILPDGHIEALLLKVRLLLFTDGGLLQNLLDTQPTTHSSKDKWSWEQQSTSGNEIYHIKKIK